MFRGRRKNLEGREGVKGVSRRPCCDRRLSEGARPPLPPPLSPASPLGLIARHVTATLRARVGRRGLERRQEEDRPAGKQESQRLRRPRSHVAAGEPTPGLHAVGALRSPRRRAGANRADAPRGTGRAPQIGGCPAVIGPPQRQTRAPSARLPPPYTHGSHCAGSSGSSGVCGATERVRTCEEKNAREECGRPTLRPRFRACASHPSPSLAPLRAQCSSVRAPCSARAPWPAPPPAAAGPPPPRARPRRPRPRRASWTSAPTTLATFARWTSRCVRVWVGVGWWGRGGARRRRPRTAPRASALLASLRGAHARRVPRGVCAPSTCIGLAGTRARARETEACRRQPRRRDSRGAEKQRPIRNPQAYHHLFPPHQGRKPMSKRTLGDKENEFIDALRVRVGLGERDRAVGSPPHTPFFPTTPPTHSTPSRPSTTTAPPPCPTRNSKT